MKNTEYRIQNTDNDGCLCEYKSTYCTSSSAVRSLYTGLSNSHTRSCCAEPGITALVIVYLPRIPTVCHLDLFQIVLRRGVYV